MEIKKRSEPFTTAEICLPLLFFSGVKIFDALLAIIVTIDLTWVFLEFLRRHFSKNDLGAFYLFWLAAIGSACWFIFHLPPYWILSVYLCIPAAAWIPSKSARSKSFFTTLIKKANRQIRPLIQMFIFMLFFAGLLFTLPFFFKKTFVWLIATGVLIGFEILLSKNKRRKA